MNKAKKLLNICESINSYPSLTDNGINTDYIYNSDRYDNRTEIYMPSSVGELVDLLKTRQASPVIEHPSKEEFGNGAEGKLLMSSSNNCIIECPNGINGGNMKLQFKLDNNFNTKLIKYVKSSGSVAKMFWDNNPRTTVEDVVRDREINKWVFKGILLNI